MDGWAVGFDLLCLLQGSELSMKPQKSCRIETHWALASYRAPCDGSILRPRLSLKCEIWETSR